MNNILIGYRAAGKSTVGRLLSEKLRLPFQDTDTLIEKEVGMPIRELVAREGWTAFREKETEVIRSLEKTPFCVVATGGGAVMNQLNRDCLKNMGILIYLRTPLPDLIERLGRDEETRQNRPSLTGESLVEETVAVLKERTPVYEAAADFTVDTDGKNIVRVSEEIYQYLLEAGIISEINKAKRRLRHKT
jgi:shikimate kinase